uniref:Band 7 domain-containing protein n=1 Tax=Tetranychus urticae TaxID=32264 RepID=T1KI89_TETUR
MSGKSYVVQDYERSVTLRLGNLVGDGAKGSGIIFIIPCIDTYCKVDLRTVSFNVPPQEVLTKDLVCIKVDAVVYYRIVDSTASILNVSDVGRSTRRLAAITLRNVVATKTLTEIISERVIISSKIENNLQEATRPWGVDVERVEMKEVRLPAQLQKLMATEAETEREASAKIIIASGEQKSSRFIRDAAATIDKSAYALQLKYLLTIDSVASAHNKDQDIIVFPFPAELAELGAKFIAKGSDKMHKNILRYFQHKNKAAQHVDPVHVDLV